MQIHEVSKRKLISEAPITGVKSGLPTPAELGKFDQRVAQAAAAQPTTAPTTAPVATATLAPRPGAATPGIASRAANYSKGLATALGYSWGQAAAQKIGAGVIGADQQNPYATGDSEEAARQKSTPLVKKQAEEQQKLFNQAVLQFMGTQGIKDPQQLSSTNKANLMKSLESQIQKNFLQNRVADWKNLTKEVDPSMASKAQQLSAEIEQAVTNITNYNTKNSISKSLQDWMQLSQATVDAMIMKRFHPPGGVAAGTPMVNAQNNNQLASAFKQAGLTAQDLGLPPGFSIARSGNPTFDAAMAAMGVNVK